MTNVLLNSSLNLYARVDLMPEFSIKSKLVTSGINMNGIINIKY